MSLARKTCLPLARQTTPPLPPASALTGGQFSNPGYGAYVDLGLSFRELRDLLFYHRKFRVDFTVEVDTSIEYIYTRQPPEAFPDAVYREKASASGTRACSAFGRFVLPPACYSLFSGKYGAPISVGIEWSATEDGEVLENDGPPLAVGELATVWEATDCYPTIHPSIFGVLKPQGYLLVAARDGQPCGAMLIGLSVAVDWNDPFRDWINPPVPPASVNDTYFYTWYSNNNLFPPLNVVGKCFAVTGQALAYSGDGVPPNPATGQTSLQGIPLNIVNSDYTHQGSEDSYGPGGAFTLSGSGKTEYKISGMQVVRL